MNGFFDVFFRDFDGFPPSLRPWKKPLHFEGLPPFRPSEKPRIPAYLKPTSWQPMLTHSQNPPSNVWVPVHITEVSLEIGSIEVNLFGDICLKNVIYFANFTNLSSKFWTRPCFESNSPRRYLITKCFQRQDLQPFCYLI